MVHSGNCPPDKDIRIIGSSGLNGQILNRIEINSVSIKNLSISPKIFFLDRTQVDLGSGCLSVRILCSDFTDVTLADEDINSQINCTVLYFEGVQIFG